MWNSISGIQTGGDGEQSRVKTTAFLCHSPAAPQVFLVGTFNDWKLDVTPRVRGLTAMGVSA